MYNTLKRDVKREDVLISFFYFYFFFIFFFPLVCQVAIVAVLFVVFHGVLFLTSKVRAPAHTHAHGHARF